jgi:hypothetical protein
MNAYRNINLNEFPEHIIEQVYDSFGVPRSLRDEMPTPAIATITSIREGNYKKVSPIIRRRIFDTFVDAVTSDGQLQGDMS